jgi:hypothetical protein
VIPVHSYRFISLAIGCNIHQKSNRPFFHTVPTRHGRFLTQRISPFRFCSKRVNTGSLPTCHQPGDWANPEQTRWPQSVRMWYTVPVAVHDIYSTSCRSRLWRWSPGRCKSSNYFRPPAAPGPSPFCQSFLLWAMMDKENGEVQRKDEKLMVNKWIVSMFWNNVRESDDDGW